MTKSNRFTSSDVRAIFRLLGEVCELGASPAVWRRHMLEGLLRLVDGSKAHAAEAPVPCSPTAPAFLGVVIAGVTEPRLLAIYRGLICERDYSDDPCVPVMKSLIRGSFTRTRQQLAVDREWYRRRDLDAWRTLGTDYFLYSHQFLSARRCIHVIALNRAWREPPFNERERRMLDLFHSELGRLWRAYDVAPWTNLPPQLRRTLELLVEGLSEKEIAAVMALSPHTTHDYVKAIYRHFDVGSHARLLAQLARSDWVRAPRLSTLRQAGERTGPSPRWPA